MIKKILFCCLFGAFLQIQSSDAFCCFPNLFSFKGEVISGGIEGQSWVEADINTNLMWNDYFYYDDSRKLMSMESYSNCQNYYMANASYPMSPLTCSDKGQYTNNFTFGCLSCIGKDFGWKLIKIDPLTKIFTWIKKDFDNSWVDQPQFFFNTFTTLDLAIDRSDNSCLLKRIAVHSKSGKFQEAINIRVDHFSKKISNNIKNPCLWATQKT